MGHRLPYEVHNCSSNNKFTALRQRTFNTAFAADFMISQLHLSTLSNHTAECILERYGYHTGCVSEIRELQTIKDFHFIFSNRNSWPTCEYILKFRTQSIKINLLLYFSFILYFERFLSFAHIWHSIWAKVFGFSCKNLSILLFPYILFSTLTVRPGAHWDAGGRKAGPSRARRRSTRNTAWHSVSAHW